MFKEFSNNQKEDDYLSEFRQKIASQQREDIEERRHELQRSRNGFIGTIAGILLAAVVSWFLLLPRFSSTETGEIPVIRRPITAVKIQPNEPGGMEILNQDKSVYALVEKKEVEPAKIESLLPPPETPKMPVIVPEPEPAETIVAATENRSAATEALSQEIEKPSLTPATEILPVKDLDEQIEAVKSNSGQKIAIPEKLPEIKVAAKTFAENPLKKEPETTAQSPASKEPAQNPKMIPATASNQTASKGMWQVQLMASSHKDAVEKGWIDLAKKHTVLRSQPHEIESAKIGSGAVFHRLKAGAFSNRNEADKLCAEIKKAGGTCIVKQK